MTPEMHSILNRISLLYAIEPEAVFRDIVDSISGLYGAADQPTMAMVNLLDGDCIKNRTVANRHRIFRRASTLPLNRTLCRTALLSSSPLVIQNAATHPDFCNHAVVRLKLRRYLGVPVCNPEGVTIGTLCLMDDRTEQSIGEQDVQFLSLLAMRVAAELERERLIEERIAAHRDYARMLEETAVEKRRFVSMVVHDLRHPLTAMRTSLYMLRSETDVTARAANLDTLENRTRALGNLLDELMEYDAVEAGRPGLKLQEFEIGRLIHDCVAEVGTITPEQPMPVICSIESGLGTACSDPGKLRHIVSNLVANAIKYTPHGHVNVRALSAGSEQWRLEVEDTGIGMDASEQEQVISSCSTGDYPRSGRTGLGLAIAGRLAMVLGARLEFSSRHGAGTLFWVDFPRRIENLQKAEL